MNRTIRPTKQVVVALVIAALLLVLTIAFQQRTRTIEGTWIDMFEGSSFFEDKGISHACSPSFQDAAWLSYYPALTSAEGKLVQANSGSATFVSEYGTWKMAAYAVRFEGHQRMLGLAFGHGGAFPSEYVVDRMISISPIPLTSCDIRPSGE